MKYRLHDEQHADKRSSKPGNKMLYLLKPSIKIYKCCPTYILELRTLGSVAGVVDTIKLDIFHASKS